MGVDAEQPNIDRDQPVDAFQKVLENVAALSANPPQDQSSLGEAGSEQEGQEPGRENPHVSFVNSYDKSAKADKEHLSATSCGAWVFGFRFTDLIVQHAHERIDGI